MAEITVTHLLRLANEHGCGISRKQCLAFLNHENVYEMWKHMMQAGEGSSYFAHVSAQNTQFTARNGHLLDLTTYDQLRPH